MKRWVEDLKMGKKHYMIGMHINMSCICIHLSVFLLWTLYAPMFKIKIDINIGNDLNKSTYVGEVLGPGGLM